MLVEGARQVPTTILTVEEWTHVLNVGNRSWRSKRKVMKSAGQAIVPGLRVVW